MKTQEVEQSKKPEAPPVLTAGQEFTKPHRDLGAMRRVRFSNLLDPKVDLSQFNFEGVFFGPILDGAILELPEEVIKHLNGIQVPDSETQPDTEGTGQLRTRMVMRPRFALVPV